eukprot:UC4_evm1s910
MLPPENGCLSGQQLRPVMLKAQPPIPNASLGGIWTKCDDAKSGNLNKEQVIRLFGLMSQIQRGEQPNVAALNDSTPPPTITGL